jgi:hypothetical protein
MGIARQLIHGCVSHTKGGKSNPPFAKAESCNPLSWPVRTVSTGHCALMASTAERTIAV